MNLEHQDIKHSVRSLPILAEKAGVPRTKEFIVQELKKLVKLIVSELIQWTEDNQNQIYCLFLTMNGCRIVEAVNTRTVGQTKLRVAQNDRTIVWSFKRGHYRRIHGGQDQEEKIRNYGTVTINVRSDM
ncbi:hypothetical protein K438DRAFT_1756668 [Mycena galopus ATCC 62051]|nr:hypothetical protein K438DRAFT_1756668 [Mycena galopus ATCC 62051]